jgi:hypothetical protein
MPAGRYSQVNEVFHRFFHALPLSLAEPIQQDRKKLAVFHRLRALAVSL